MSGGKSFTVVREGKTLPLADVLKGEYDKVAGINDSLSQSSQRGNEAID